MADVVGVVFRGGVKVYHFDPAGLELSRGDRVVVTTSSGPEIGQVVEPPHTVEDSDLPAPLKKVVRLATGADLDHVEAGEELRREAMLTCREMIAQHGLDMKLVDADICFGGEKITFSFYAEERVDFRGLVADLAKALKRRIELRQVGAREEARMVGGLGPCGRALCCSCFQGDDTPVSIRMAKEQNLPLNPMKISGLCGRLMCCLKYEQEQYVQFRKEAPAKGTKVVTLTGDGAVTGYNFTKQAIAVRLEDGTTTEVRLSSCETQENGDLVVIPEAPVEEPSPMGWLDSRFGNFDRLVEDRTEDLPVVEAEVILNEKGEPIEVSVTESTRKRGRRGRGRRRGGGGGEAAGDGVTSEGAASAGREPRANAGAREGGRSGGGERRPGADSRRGQGGGQRQGGGGRGGAAGPGYRSTRWRRRPGRRGRAGQPFGQPQTEALTAGRAARPASRSGRQWWRRWRGRRRRPRAGKPAPRCTRRGRTGRHKLSGQTPAAQTAPAGWRPGWCEGGSGGGGRSQRGRRVAPGE